MAKIFKTRIQLKNDSATNWASTATEGQGANLQLLKGEVAIVNDFVVDNVNYGVNFKIGDGTNKFSALPYLLLKVAAESGISAPNSILSLDSARVTATTTGTLDLTASTAYGVVKGSDISEIKSYIDAKSTSLTKAGYSQSEVSTSAIKIYGIKQENGLIDHDDTKDITFNLEGTYDASTNKIATQTTVSNAIDALDVTEYAQAVITPTSDSAAGSLAIKGISEANGKISVGTTSVTLTVGDGLKITTTEGVHKLGHSNAIAAETTGLGSVDSTTSHTSKVLTGVKFDAQGHFTAATETELVAAAIKNAASGNLTSTNVQAALEELQRDIDGIIAGTQFKGEFTSADDWATKTAKKSKVGDTYIYTGSTTITLLTKTVEQNDLVVISAVNDDKTPTAIVVVERSLDHAVTNTGGGTYSVLTADKLVLGAGNDTVKTSTYEITTTVASGELGDVKVPTEKVVGTMITNAINTLDASTVTVTSVDTASARTGSEVDHTLTFKGVKEADGVIAQGENTTNIRISKAAQTGYIEDLDYATIDGENTIIFDCGSSSTCLNA